MNLFELAAKITLNADDYEKGINKAKAGMSNLANHIGNGLKTAAKVGTAAIGAASAGIAVLTKKALDSYANYEQLVGGVETLFKGSAGKVQSYAEDAFKTAGMSANQYMETVTSFSASLLQSLGGDTEKAADYAHQAIVDMSDNANKMGTSMEMIQNAYNGFAKSNYTMLDNLKLGYGGTQAEMKRLIADAAKLDKSVDANSMSFGNVVKAIHAVQTEMGITGTTAKEASSTIEGSISSMKSAWENLVTGLGNENASLDVLINDFASSVGTVAENVVPRIGQILESVGSVIERGFPIVLEKIPTAIQGFLPKLISSGGEMINSLVSGISENQDTLISTAEEALKAFIAAAGEAIPNIIEIGAEILLGLAQGIADNIPEIVPATVEVILNICQTVIDNLDKILDSALEIITALGKGLVDSIPELATKVPEIIGGIVGFLLDHLPDIFAVGWDIIVELAKGIVEHVPDLLDSATEMIDKICEGLANGLERIKDMGSDVVDKIQEGIESAWNGFVNWWTNLWNSVFGSNDINVNINASENLSSTETAKGPKGSHAGGLAYVPVDGYRAILHKGERVLTAEENKSGGHGGVVINQYIQTVPQTPVELAAAMTNRLEEMRWAGAF